MNINLKRKKFYPVGEDFNSYLGAYGRTMDFPELYEDLHRFSQLYPLFDREGEDTLWKTVFYEPAIREELNTKLTRIYSALRTNAPKTQDHLRMERVDFCDFGNSRPFRIRIVNQYNDNYDHFYVKIADASRLYGLELEHVLSPNRINYLVNGNTLIEDHIAGVPGDTFIADYFDRPDTNLVRVAKEFVKFNERSFVRLLGDMRSYNYVVDITPDFEDAQYRVRAIDFDQQSYEGNKEMYLPQTFLENEAVVHLCTTKLNYQTMRQYQEEERTLIQRRCKLAQTRLAALWEVMLPEELSPYEHVEILRDGLNQYHETSVFDSCETMGQLVKLNLETSLLKQSAE